MTRPRSLEYSLCLLLTVPMVCGGARRVKDDLVVLPKALEEIQGSALAIAVLRCKLQNFGESSVPVDGAEQPVLERSIGENKIRKCVRPVNQHRDATRRQTLPNAHCPWQRNGNVVAPTFAGECDRLAVIGAIIAIGDETVRRPLFRGTARRRRAAAGRAARRDARRAGYGHHPALGEVGRLLDPAPEGHAAPIEPCIQLRDGVGAILGMKECVRHRFRPPEILRPAQQA